MKKTYTTPCIQIAAINIKNTLLAGTGVTNGSSLGDEYSSTDVTYSRNGSLWDDED